MTTQDPLPKSVDATDLIVWYRCLAGAGSILPDSSGQGHDAKVQAAQWSGYALDFTAQSDVRTPGPLPCKAQFTLAAWIRPSQLATPNPILSQPGYFSFKTRPDGLMLATSGAGDAVSQRNGQPPSPLTAGQWQHVAVVVDAEVDHEATFYVQGSPWITVPLQDKAPGWIDGRSSPLLAGQDESGHFQGAIGELIYFHRLLAPWEIAALAAPPRLVPCPTSHRFYQLADAPGSGGFFGYFLLAKDAPADLQYPCDLFSLLTADGWKEMPGHLVFAPGEPEHFADLASRLDGELPPVDPQAPGAAPLLAWVPGPEEPDRKTVWVPTVWGASDSRHAVLTVTATLQRTQNFGDYQWSLPAGTALTLRSTDTELLLAWPGGQGPGMLVPDATTPGQSNIYKNLEALGSTLSLSGDRAGAIRAGLTAAKSDLDKLRAGFRFFVHDWNGIDVYKFDLIAAGDPAMPATLSCVLHWFPGAPDDPQWSFLALPPGVTLPTTYTLVEGGRVSLVTTDDSRLGFVTYIAAPHRRGHEDSGYLTPAGVFTVAGIGQDRHLLAGLKGTESLEVSDGDRAEFVPGQPAVTLVTKTGKDGKVVLTTRKQGGTFGPLQTGYVSQGLPISCTTSWLRLTRGGSPARYGNQPEKAPLYSDQGSATLQHQRSVFQPLPEAFPVIPYAGTVDWTSNPSSPAELEQQVIAPARRQALISPDSRHDHTAAGPAKCYATTPQGLRVGLDQATADARWCELVLAQSPDAKAPTDPGAVRWTQLTDEVWRLLSHNEVFAVVSTTGGGLFKTSGRLDLSGWSFDLTVENDAAAVAADAAPTILILKLAQGKLSDLVGQTGRWADAEVFNGPGDAVVRVARRIADILQYAKGVPAEIAPLYQHLLSVADNPHWTGLVAFNADIAKAPPVIESMLEGLPGAGAFYARHVVIPISKTHAADLLQADSAIFALVDYEGIEDGKLDLLTDTSGKPQGAFDFGVPYLRAQFENAQLRHFECEVALGIHQLFGASVRLTAGGGDAQAAASVAPVLKPFIILKGSYQTPAGTDARTEAGTFSFQYRGDTVLTVQGQDVLQEIHITKAGMKGVSATISGDEQTSRSVARFSLAGELVFRSPTSDGLVDAFNYDLLPFTELGLVKTLQISDRKSKRPRVQVDWLVDTARTAFDAVSATVRDGLVKDFPLRLKSFLSNADGYSLTDHGYQPVQLPLTGEQGSLRFGFLYQLDLGRPGALATNAPPLTGFLLTGWNPGGDPVVGLRIEGLRSDLTLPLEGVMHLEIGGFALKKLGAKGDPTSLILRGCRLGLLGKSFPPAPLSFDMVLQGVGKKDGVIWAGQLKPKT